MPFLLVWSSNAIYFSMTPLWFNEWMTMLTFGFPFCNFDLKIWNFAIKIGQTFCQFVHLGQGQTESEAYSVPLVCPYWSVHWHQTKKVAQLDTPKINEVVFLLHGCKKHTLEFLLSVSSTNNVPLVKVCAKSWTETIWVAYLLLLESVYRIFPQFNSAKSWFHLHTLLGVWLYSFRIEYTRLEPRFKITDHGFESDETNPW